LAIAYSLASAPNIAARLKEALALVELPAPTGFWVRLFAKAKAERRRRAELVGAVRAAVEKVVDRTMARPSRQVMDDRRQLGELMVEVCAGAELAAVPALAAPRGGGGLHAAPSE
jgi:hypothetical protein